ncbi:MAG: sodium-dependent bicarbonate transport family permease [Spirochaetaceae bacterium]|nr:sodium-dependent bicarbonate transport family permease [Myxococcales bacterium]MCB9723244.1 sodium-dependent bicarbonate transport family permease [Spirochaetaceae bacterium]
MLENLLSAPVLFFALGVAARLVRSDLEIPQPVARFLSLYLLLSIGIKGGHELHEAGLTSDVLAGLGAAVALSVMTPVWTFFLLRRSLGSTNAAGVAATYGSISAVTFVVATSFLDQTGVGYGGHMVAAMALMESPAIVMGILLAQRFPAGGPSPETRPPLDWGGLLREAAFNPAVFLLLGSMVIGMTIGPAEFLDVAPFVSSPFKGVLCFFLLEMGLLAARRLRELHAAGLGPLVFAIVAPPAHAALAIGLAWSIGLDAGDALLLAVLGGSASYIAVPAALRLSLPEANPSLYVPMSLALTFPFNVIIGIPLYWWAIQSVGLAGVGPY